MQLVYKFDLRPIVAMAEGEIFNRTGTGKISMAGMSIDPKTCTTDYIASDFNDMTFLGVPHADALALAVQALAGELWTTRRRLHVVEALMEKAIPLTTSAIEGYVPTIEEEQRWKTDRDRLVSGVYEPFLRGDGVAYASREMMQYDPHKEPATARRPAASVGQPAPAAPIISPYAIPTADGRPAP